MGLAMLAPGERTDVQLLDSHSTSSLVSIFQFVLKRFSLKEAPKLYRHDYM